MKALLTVSFILWLTLEVFSQPLNGSFTIGGQSPDFATLQEAADALKQMEFQVRVF
jgi:hypothetical protein